MNVLTMKTKNKVCESSRRFSSRDSTKMQRIFERGRLQDINFNIPEITLTFS